MRPVCQTIGGRPGVVGQGIVRPNGPSIMHSAQLATRRLKGEGGGWLAASMPPVRQEKGCSNGIPLLGSRKTLGLLGPGSVASMPLTVKEEDGGKEEGAGGCTLQCVLFLLLCCGQ